MPRYTPELSPRPTAEEQFSEEKIDHIIMVYALKHADTNKVDDKALRKVREHIRLLIETTLNNQGKSVDFILSQVNSSQHRYVLFNSELNKEIIKVVKYEAAHNLQ